MFVRSFVCRVRTLLSSDGSTHIARTHTHNVLWVTYTLNPRRIVAAQSPSHSPSTTMCLFCLGSHLHDYEQKGIGEQNKFA